MPTVQFDTLTYQQNGQDYTLAVGTPTWYTWLTTASTFTFTSEYGAFTAHKERSGNRRGGWYWKAYRKQGGKLHRAYLGKSEHLTLERWLLPCYPQQMEEAIPNRCLTLHPLMAYYHRSRC